GTERFTTHDRDDDLRDREDPGCCKHERLRLEPPGAGRLFLIPHARAFAMCLFHEVFRNARHIKMTSRIPRAASRNRQKSSSRHPDAGRIPSRATGRRTGGSDAGGPSKGRANAIVVPPLLVAQMRPPCASTMVLA